VEGASWIWETPIDSLVGFWKRGKSWFEEGGALGRVEDDDDDDDAGKGKGGQRWTHR